MVWVLPQLENEDQNKHVESVWFPCLDEGSTPSSSTLLIKKPLNISGFFFIFLFFYFLFLYKRYTLYFISPPHNIFKKSITYIHSISSILRFIVSRETIILRLSAEALPKMIKYRLYNYRVE